MKYLVKNIFLNILLLLLLLLQPEKFKLLTLIMKNIAKNKINNKLKFFKS
jgi:hypothetical protein